MRTGQTTSGHSCDAFTATDPDEAGARVTHLLAGKRAALGRIGNSPRKCKPVVILAYLHAAIDSATCSAAPKVEA